MERNEAISGTQRQVDLYIEFLRRTLRRDKLGAAASPSNGPWDYDLLFAVENESWTMRAEVKSDPLTSRGVNQLVETQRGHPTAQLLVISPFISPQLQARLLSAGINYWDSTGNSFLDIDRPRLLVRTVGALKNPLPRTDKSVQVSLRGTAAARVVIFLLSNPELPSMREVASQTGVGLGTVGRVVDLLKREALVEEEAGRSRLSSRAQLMSRWIEDYTFIGNSRTRRFVATFGANETLDRLRESRTTHALTGLAAQHLLLGHAVVPVFSTDETWIYIAGSDSDLESAGLVRVPRGGNFVVIAGKRPEGLFGSSIVKGQVVANHWRVAADLLSSPGRERAAGEQLLGALLKSHPEESVSRSGS